MMEAISSVKPGAAVSPYYSESGITIYHGKAEEILPQLGRFDLVLTDPPYGIGRAAGMGGGGFDGSKKYKREPKRYAGEWDDTAPDADLMEMVLAAGKEHIIWSGNYFGPEIGQGNKWLVWDKENQMPSYSDAELAKTNLPGNSVQMFRYGQNKHRAKEARYHPTQKPVWLFQWCLGLASDPASVVDPFARSGTTALAARELGIEAVLIEQDAAFCEIAVNRLSQSLLPLSTADHLKRPVKPLIKRD